MDGTLIDNMSYHTAAWMRLFQEMDLNPDPDEFQRKHSGKPTFDVLGEIFSGNMDEEEILAFAERKELIYQEICRPHLKPLAGLDSFLKESKALGVALAVASSARQGNIDFILEGLGIKKMFDVIVGSYDVTRGKPDPEMFLLAARRMNLPPERCLVFEDAPAGIQAAENAGMRTIVLTTQLTEKEASQNRHVVIAVPDFTTLQPELLIKQL